MLGSAQQLAVIARAEQYEIDRASLGDLGLDAHHRCRRHSHQTRPFADRMIEMGDPHRLCEHLERVVIAIGVERVAAVVARCHGPAARSELVEQGHAAPARRAVAGAIHQIEVAHRQTDDGQTRLGDQIHRPVRFRGRLQRQAAAMADDDLPAKPPFDRD